MATIIRDFLAVFGVEVEAEDLDDFDERVERLGKTLDDAKGRITDFASSLSQGLTVAVAGASAAMTGIISSTVETALEMDRLAQSLNFNVESFQAYAGAARNAGLEADDLQDIIGTLSERLVDAGIDGAGSDAAMMAERLGISLKNAAGEVKGTEELFLEVADAIQTVPDGAERAAIALTFFGDVGLRALPFLNQGSEAIRAQADEMRQLGLVMSEDGIKRARQFQERMSRVRAVVMGAAQAIALEFLPHIESAAERFEAWWRQGNRVQQILKILGPALRVAGIAFGALVGAKALLGLSKLVQLLGAMVTVLRSVSVAATLAQAKLLLIPAAILAAFLVMEDFFVFLQGGDSKIGQFVDKFEESEGPLGMLARALKEVRNIILQEVVPVLPEIKAALADAWEVIDRDLLPAIKEVAKVVGGVLTVAFKRWAKGLAPTVRMMSEMFQRWAKGVRLMSRRFNKWSKETSRDTKAATSTFSALFGTAFTVFRKDLGLTDEKLGKLWGSMRDGATDAAEWVKGVFSGIGDSATDAFNRLKEIMTEPFRDLADLVGSIFTGIAEAWNKLSEIMVRIGKKIKDAFSLVGESLRLAFVTVKVAILEVIGSIVSALDPVFEQLQSAIDGANKLGAGIDIDLRSGGASIESSIREAQAEQRASAGRLAVLAGRGASQTEVRQNNDFKIEINIPSGTSATPGQIQNAVRGGVTQGASDLERREAARDLQTG